MPLEDFDVLGSPSDLLLKIEAPNIFRVGNKPSGYHMDLYILYINDTVYTKV